MEGEADVDHQRSAVLEADQGIGHVFDRVEGSVVICRLIKGIVLDIRAIAQFRVNVATHGLHLRSAHQVPAEVDDVHADVDQRTAARACLVGKPAARIA
ncbi:hypothetical protein D3C81_1649880 [compost metagenome]